MSHDVNLREHGCELFTGVADGHIDELVEILSAFDNGAPGQRISRCPRLAEWLEAVVGSTLDQILPRGAQPVRAILFDKSPASNWALGWHQDRTICVRERHDVPGFGPWTTKNGLIHVEPPFDIIERMVTLRIHIDPVSPSNAPLIVAAGSHLIGKVASENAESAASFLIKITCLAERGDIWAYSTPILHTSERSASGRRRRVLQLDFSPDELPGQLEWLGIA